MQSYTFFPNSQVLYSGEAADINELGMNTEFMAEFNKLNSVPANSAIMDKDSQKYVENNYSGNAKPIYRVKETRSDLRQLFEAQTKISHYKKMSRGQGQFNADVMNKLRDAYDEYKAVVNGTNTDQLTIVQFVNQIIGRLEQPSYITSAFKNIPLDKLRGKIPEMGWPAVNLQVDRLSEPQINSTQFGQTEFRIKRNDVHIYISREDRMEATIDPFATSIMQGNIQLQRARELMALKALSGLTVNGTYGTIPDMSATPSGSSAPGSTNDAPSAFVNVMVSHFNKYYNYIKYFIWNPLDYRAYLANWFTHAYTQIQVPEGFGVVPFFGLEKYGAIAIVSPYVPRSFVYALANEGAYELDGPKVVDSEYDARKFADYNIVHDFVGYVIANPLRFGEKLSVPLAGVTAGTEITTDKQIYALLAPPANLVVKNTNKI